MSALATRREHSAVGRLFEPPTPDDDGVTLEDSILAVWEDLVVAGQAECPVCGERLRAAAPCVRCGSELA